MSTLTGQDLKRMVLGESAPGGALTGQSLKQLVLGTEPAGLMDADQTPVFAGSSIGMPGKAMRLQPAGFQTAADLQAHQIETAIGQRAGTYTPEQISQGRQKLAALGSPHALGAAFKGVAEGSIGGYWDDAQVARWMAEDEMFPQGIMREPEPVRGPAALGIETRRALSYAVPPVGSLAEWKARQQLSPETAGGFSTAGKVIGSAAPSLAMVFVPGGAAAIPAQFAGGAADEHLRGGGTIAGAIGAGLAEGGTEYLGSVFDRAIIGGVANAIRRTGRESVRGVVSQTLRAGAQAAGTEIGEEEVNLLANAVIGVAEGRSTVSEAVQQILMAQPELVTVAGLAGALTGGAGTLIQAGAGGAAPAGGPSATRPPTRAIAEPSAGSIVSRSETPSPGAPQPVQQPAQPAPAVEPASSVASASRAPQSIAEILPPQPDQVLEDGTAVFRDGSAAGAFVEFRNARREPGAPPLRAVEVMPGAAASPWAVVPDTRLQAAQQRGAAQTADVEGFTRQALEGGQGQSRAANLLRRQTAPTRGAGRTELPGRSQSGTESATPAPSPVGSAPVPRGVIAQPSAVPQPAPARSPAVPSAAPGLAEGPEPAAASPASTPTAPAQPATPVESRPSEAPSPESTPAQPEAARQPWEMTREEFTRPAREGLKRARDAAAKSRKIAPNASTRSIYVRAAETGLREQIKTYETGLALDEAQHRREVKQALASGLPVPPEVLAEYPDLTVKPAAQPGATVKPAKQPGATVKPEASTAPTEVRNGQELWLKNRDGDGFTPTKVMAVKQMFGQTHVRLLGGEKWFKLGDLDYRTQPPERGTPQPEEPAAAPSVESGESTDVQDQPRQPERVQPRSEPADEGTPRVARGEPGRSPSAPEPREPASPEPAPRDGEPSDSRAGAGDRPRDATRRRRGNRDGDGRAEPQREPGGERVEPGARGAREPARDAGAERPADVRDRNHRIEPGHDLAAPGVVGKVQANIKAIKLLKALEDEGRNPTPDEKQTLAQYVGWGGVSQALDEVKGERWSRWEGDQSRAWNKPDDATEKWAKRWFKHYQTIRELLTKEEFRDAAETTLNAHYTSREVISQALWPIAERLGFKGGNVIETSAGIGHIIGLQPEKSANTSKWTAVEIDSLSSRILRKLYPEARVLHTPFEKAALRNNTFDLVVSNFPFAQAGTGDTRYPKDFALHNYFFARSVDLVRPGGLIVSITSDSSMDRGRSRQWRVWMAERADLVGAIRLPNNAFAQNAGTEVTTDILIFRKKDGRPLQNAEPFIEAPMLDIGKGEETEVNEYFHRHPEMMLGRMSLEGTMYRDKSPALLPTPGDLSEKISAAIDRLPKSISTLDPLIVNPEAKQSADEEYSFQLVEGKAGQVRDGQWSPLAGVQEPRARSYVGIRSKTLGLIRAQLDEDAADSDVEAKRTALRKSYEAHVQKHGNIGDRSHSFLREDPDYSKVAALEIVKAVPKAGKGGRISIAYEFEPAPILTTRTQHPVKPPESADTIDDAIEISLAWSGAIDPAYVARLLGIEESEARQRMLDQSDVYLDPQSGMIVAADEYLSGNVRDKLRVAEDQAQHDPQYQRNVAALKDAQPEPVSIADVNFSFGGRWIPIEAYNAYLKERFGSGVTISKVEATGSLVMNQSRYGEAQRSSNNDSMGGGGMKALAIIESLVGLKMPVVYDTVPKEGGGTRQVKNPDNTIAAQSAAESIREDFVKWARSNSLAPTIEDAYNQTYNGVVARRWAPPKIKHYPGAATTIELRDHQKAAVRRGVSQSYLNAHSVGTGKTFVEITTAMEWRRLGLAKKPLLVVQNATVEQVARSFAQLYPNARVLTPHKQSMSADERRGFLNRIATGDWDCVVVPQSFYNGLKDDPGRVSAYVNEQIDKLVEAIIAAGGDPNKDSRNADPTVKNLQKRLKSLKKELDSLLSRKVDDDALSFEELGVDGLLVDEAHAYKKLQFFTEMDNVKGLDTGFSQRGLSMLLKARHVQERTGGRNTILLTGTPVTNTLAEAWSMMRYVRPDILDANKIAEFDDFGTAFTLTSTETEMDAVGRFRETTRLREFVNVPELQAIWSEVADVVRAEDLDLPRPTLKGGGPTIIEIDPSDKTTAVMKDLIFEYEAWEKLPGKEKREQSHVPLTINTKARKAALDIRLLYPDAKPDPTSKLSKAIEEVYQRWARYKDQRLTQAVFADMFRSGEGGFNAFEEIRRQLVERGVPESEIALIHEHDSKARREALFERVNEGKVRVVMGTTEKLGVGVNIQTRLQALHHLDAPWRPSDMEQREGRIVRQGNLVPDLIGEGVEILRYGVKRTFDAGQYERLARKQKMINDVLSGRNVGRTIEDAGQEQIASFSEASAAFSGDPRVRELASLRQEIAKLEAAERGHQTDIVQAQRKLSEWRRAMPQMTADASKAREFHDQHRAGMAGGEIRTPAGKTDAKGFQKWVTEQIDQLAEDAEEIRAQRHRKEIGTVNVGGVDFQAAVQGPGTDTGRLSRKFAGVSLSTTIPSGHMLGSSITAYDNAENLLGAVRADFNDLPAVANQLDRTVADRNSKIPALEELTTKRFPQAERLDEARKQHDALLAELEKETKEAKAAEQDDAGGPTSAPDGGPERSKRPAQRFLDAIDAMEKSARERIRRRQLPRGRDIGGTTLPEDVADIVIVGAAKLLKGTTKFGVWSKEMATEFGKRVKSRIREVWKQSRDLAQDITDGLEHPEPTVERVKRRIAEAEDQDKAPTPGSTPETRAVHIAYRAGLRAARDELPAIKQKLTDALKLQGKARADTIQGIRLEIRRLVEENLPIEYRGRFLPEVTRATTYARLSQAINKIRREVARSTAAQDLRQIKRMAKYAKLLSPRPPSPGRKSPRAEFNDMLQRVVHARDQLLRTGRGIVPTDEMEDAAADIREMKEDMGSLIADAMALRKAIAGVKVQTAAQHAEDLAAAVRANKPSRADETPTDVRTGAAGSANLLYTDLRNLTERLEGGAGIAHALMFKRMGIHHEAYLSALRDSAEVVDQAVRAAGFKNIADAMTKLSGRRGGGVTQTATVRLGGQEHTIARGELMSLYAMDRATRARIDQGSSIQIARGRRRTPIQATLAEIDKATRQLSKDERALVDALKAAIDSHRDALFEAHFRLKGYYPEEVSGYWPSKRNIRFSPNRGLPEGWRGIRERYMENVGFLQEREGGTLPFVVGDALTVALEHIDASLKVIHLAEPTRDAASVLLNPDVVAAVNERFGTGYNRAIEDYLRAISLAQEADMTTAGEFVRWMNSNLATAKLGINPGSWLKQLGGLPRMAATMPTGAFMAGLAGWRSIDTADLIRRSGYFWERYVGNLAGRFTPIGGESYADVGKTAGILGLEDAAANFLSAIRTRKMSDLKAAYDNLRHAAGTSLEVLNFFDAINARIAYAGWLAEAKRKYPAWDAHEQEGWAITKAAETIRETQNSSSVLDAPLAGVRARGNVGASLLIFTSDTLKARNRLEAARRRGRSELARHATAEALNVMWARSVSFGVGAGIAAGIIALTGGDRDDWERWREKYLDLEKQLTYGASDLLSIADPVIAPTVLRMVQYPFEEINLPAFEAISDASQALFSAGRAGLKVPADSRKIDDFAARLAKAANAVSGTLGLNPVETVVNRILDQLEDQAEEKPRRRRRVSRERRERN